VTESLDFPIVFACGSRAASAEAAVRDLAERLAAAGFVKASFADAAVARERKSPTGLPFAPPAVALPHADGEHVLRPALAIASLAAPVVFREMGSPASKVDVGLVVMPALTSKEQAAGVLGRLIERLQDDAVRAALASAQSEEEMRRALTPQRETR
jgi:PTS system galactitol-specific IIA component